MKRWLLPGDQLTVGEYMDLLRAGAQWKGKGRSPAIHPVSYEVIFRDHWITGNYFYMTNDKTLDSVDLGPIKPSLMIELLEK